MTAARTYTAEPDYLADGGPTVPIRVRCGCGPVLQPIPLHMTLEGLLYYRNPSTPPGLVVQTWRCPRCKLVVKITAQMLGLAA